MSALIVDPMETFDALWAKVMETSARPTRRCKEKCFVEIKTWMNKIPFSLPIVSSKTSPFDKLMGLFVVSRRAVGIASATNRCPCDISLSDWEETLDYISGSAWHLSRFRSRISDKVFARHVCCKQFFFRDGAPVATHF